MSERVDYCKTCWHSAPGHKADCPVAPAAAAQVVDRAMKDAATRAAIQTLDELVAERDTLRADLAEGKEQFSALDEQHHNLLRSEEALRADLAAAHTALAGRDAYVVDASATIQTLNAELASAKDRLAASLPLTMHREILAKRIDERDAALSALAPMEANDRRYRWLRENCVGYAMHSGAVLYTPELVVPRGMQKIPTAIDAAIDAATQTAAEK